MILNIIRFGRFLVYLIIYDYYQIKLNYYF